MKIKTYGINGLSEWHGNVKAGTISVAVSFTGGTASPSGAQPAYFVTKDPIAQFVIENSAEFKRGFIHLEMSQDAPGEHPRMALPKEEAPKQAPAEAAPTQEYVEKKFACGDDAKAYLMEEHGFPISHLRNKSQMEAAAAQVGIKIVWG